MNQKIYALLLLTLFFGTATFAQNIVTVSDGDLVGGQTYNWTNDNIYLLDGFVFLEEGGVLNIEAGTVVKGKEMPSTGELASTLIITRGAKIYANGTATSPIIFTAESDDTNDPEDLGKNQRGLWGGLIILGRGILGAAGGESGVEGIPATETRARYGGTNNADTSGVIRHVSIRHGGAELAPGDEINGLTLAGVGSATIVEYVEVFANDDDGIEWFGGAVNVKYAVASFCADDHFDWDFGWRGKGQFWFAIHDQGPLSAGRGGEFDGASPDNQDPNSQPTIYNLTLIGSGAMPTELPDGEGNDIGMLFRDRTGGFIWNSIVTEFAGVGLAIEDRADTETGDSYALFVNGDLRLKDNLWWNFGVGNDPANFATLSNDAAPLADDKMLLSILTADDNQAVDPLLAGISRNPDGMLDPRPNVGPARGNATLATDAYFTAANFHGAFDPAQPLWLEGWSALSQYGYLGNLVGTADIVKENSGFVFKAPTPTPARDQAQVQFELPRAATVSLAVFDLKGQLVQWVINNQRHTAGEYTSPIGVNNLAAGTYVVVLSADGVQLAHKLMVVH